MSEANKKLVRRWFDEVWNKGRVSTIEELLAPNAVVHGLAGDRTGPEEFKKFHAIYRGMFPDMKLAIEDVVAEGDRVAARFSVAATHTGNGPDLAATGKRASFTGMVFVRIAKGRIVEGWNNFDEAGMMRQLSA